MNSNIDEKEGKKFFSKIGFTFLGLTFFTMVCQVIVGILIYSFPSDLTTNTAAITIISAITTYIIPIPFFLYIMNHFKKYDIDKKKMGILKFIACIIVTFALTYIGNMIGLTITSIIGNILNSPITNPVVEMVGSTDMWTAILVMVILAPIFEEYFFRKVLIDRTIKYGGIASVLISATLFAFYHGNFNQFFYAFFIGAFFAIIYVKTGDLKYSVALHALVNFSGSVGSMFLSSLLETNIPQDISNLTDAELMTHIADYPGIILAFGLSIFVLLIILIGVLLIILYYKKVDLPKGEILIKNSSIFLNVGMICFILYYLVEIGFSFFR